WHQSAPLVALPRANGCPWLRECARPRKLLHLCNMLPGVITAAGYCARTRRRSGRRFPPTKKRCSVGWLVRELSGSGSSDKSWRKHRNLTESLALLLEQRWRLHHGELISG